MIARKLLTWPVLALGLAALVLGPGLLWTHLRTLRTQAVEGWEQTMSDDDLEAHIRVQVRDLDRQLQDYRIKAGKVAERAAAVEVNIQDLEKQLATRKQRLGRIQELLDHGKGNSTIAGRTYTPREIEEEGKILLDACRRLEQRLTDARKLVAKLREALTQSGSHLAEARRMKQQLLAEMETTRARLNNARLGKELGELNEGLREAPVGPSSDLARQMSAFRDRARQAESQADALLAEPRSGGIIDWEATGPDGDVRASIQQYLQSDKQTTPAR
jgi:DNA repair exonuclease SbcCD ATPase subunit